jgi:protein disulfide-isomerase
MKVDIWSDVMCPFCYIGKRRFEQALAQFPHKEDIEVEWHSFQLDPTIESGHGKDLNTYLAERKGQSREWATKMNTQVSTMAAADGLQYNLERAIVANSYDAHRLSHFAKKRNLGDAMEEALFKAYFTDGKDIGDYNTLIAIAKEIGLDEAEAKQVLEGDAYSQEVDEDLYVAQKIGINGVPFFVLDNKYGVSGAQPADVFAQALQQAYEPYAKSQPKLDMLGNEANTCTDDNCTI